MIHYSNTCIKQKFEKVLKIIAKMLSKDAIKRPDCRQLLAKSKEWTIDANTIKSDEYFEEFLTLSENDVKLNILREFIEIKLQKPVETNVKYYYKMFLTNIQSLWN